MVKGMGPPPALLPTSLQTRPCQGLLLRNKSKRTVNIAYEAHSVLSTPRQSLNPRVPGTFSAVGIHAPRDTEPIRTAQEWGQKDSTAKG